MPYVTDIFYNSRRLRAGWRLLLFLFVTVFTGLAFFWPVGAPLQWLLVKLLDPDPSRAQILYEGILVPGLLAASWYMVVVIDRRPWRSLGLPWGQAYLRHFLWGCALGLALIGSETLFALLFQAASWVPFVLDINTIKLLIFSLIAWLGVALLEELFFRGYLLQTLIEGLGVAPALLLSSLLFGLMHYQNAPQHWLYVLDAGTLGLVMALMAFKTKALWLPIGFHFANDFFIDLFSWFPHPIPTSLQITASDVILDIVFALPLAALVFYSGRIRPTEEMSQLFSNYLKPAHWGGRQALEEPVVDSGDRGQQI